VYFYALKYASNHKKRQDVFLDFIFHATLHY